MNVPDALLNHLSVHWRIYTTAGTALFVAGVCTMPQKMPMIRANHPVQEVWTWIRDALQTAVPAARAAHIQNPIKPENPAQPQK